MDSTDCMKANTSVVDAFWQTMEGQLVQAGLDREQAIKARKVFQSLPWKDICVVSWSDVAGDLDQVSCEGRRALDEVLQEVRGAYRILEAGNVIEGNATHSRHLELRSEILGLREDIVTLRAETVSRLLAWTTVAMVMTGIAFGFFAGSIV